MSMTPTLHARRDMFTPKTAPDAGSIASCVLRRPSRVRPIIVVSTTMPSPISSSTICVTDALVSPVVSASSAREIGRSRI